MSSQTPVLDSARVGCEDWDAGSKALEPSAKTGFDRAEFVLGRKNIQHEIGDDVRFDTGNLLYRSGVLIVRDKPVERQLQKLP